jgi:hypothetical protein
VCIPPRRQSNTLTVMCSCKKKWCVDTGMELSSKTAVALNLKSSVLNPDEKNMDKFLNDGSKHSPWLKMEKYYCPVPTGVPVGQHSQFYRYVPVSLCECWSTYHICSEQNCRTHCTSWAKWMLLTIYCICYSYMEVRLSGSSNLSVRDEVSLTQQMMISTW